MQEHNHHATAKGQRMLLLIGSEIINEEFITAIDLNFNHFTMVKGEDGNRKVVKSIRITLGASPENEIMYKADSTTGRALNWYFRESTAAQLLEFQSRENWNMPRTFDVENAYLTLLLAKEIDENGRAIMEDASGEFEFQYPEPLRGEDS